eukprot:495924_1
MIVYYVMIHVLFDRWMVRCKEYSGLFQYLCAKQWQYKTIISSISIIFQIYVFQKCEVRATSQEGTESFGTHVLRLCIIRASKHAFQKALKECLICFNLSVCLGVCI